MYGITQSWYSWSGGTRSLNKTQPNSNDNAQQFMLMGTIMNKEDALVIKADGVAKNSKWHRLQPIGE